MLTIYPSLAFTTSSICANKLFHKFPWDTLALGIWFALRLFQSHMLTYAIKGTVPGVGADSPRVNLIAKALKSCLRKFLKLFLITAENPAGFGSSKPGTVQKKNA